MVHSSGDPTVVDLSEDEGFPLRGNRCSGCAGKVTWGAVHEDEWCSSPNKVMMVLTKEWESDTETVGGAPDVEDVGEVVEPTAVETPVQMEARVRAPARAFAGLDVVHLNDLFENRARVMRSVPHVQRELSEWIFESHAKKFLAEMEANSEVRTARSWKLLLVLPHDALPTSGRSCLPQEARPQSQAVSEGDWILFLRESVSCADAAHNSVV